MAKEVRGAVKILESDLDGEVLAETLRTLMEDDQKRLHSMQENIRKYKLTDKHGDLCTVVCEVAGIKVR